MSVPSFVELSAKYQPVLQALQAIATSRDYPPELKAMEGDYPIEDLNWKAFKIGFFVGKGIPMYHAFILERYVV